MASSAFNGEAQFARLHLEDNPRTVVVNPNVDQEIPPRAVEPTQLYPETLHESQNNNETGDTRSVPLGGNEVQNLTTPSASNPHVTSAVGSAELRISHESRRRSSGDGMDNPSLTS